jgi:hypothetical protein
MRAAADRQAQMRAREEEEVMRRRVCSFTIESIYHCREMTLLPVS